MLYKYILAFVISLLKGVLGQHPWFSLQPQNVTVREGPSFIIKCTIENLPLQSYVQWVLSPNHASTWPREENNNILAEGKALRKNIKALRFI